MSELRERLHLSQKESLTTSEVAAMFRVKVATVRRWLRVGKLRGTPLSGRSGWRVAPSEVRRFAAEYRAAGAGG